MSKSKEKALNLARQARKGVKKFARGGDVDINDTFDPTEGGNIPRVLQQKVRQLPRSWTPPNAPPVRSQTPDEDLHNFINRYAEGGEVDDGSYLPLTDDPAGGEPSFKARWLDRAAGAYAAPKQNPFLFRALFDEGKSRNPYESDLSKIAQSRAFGELKGTAPEDTPTAHRLKGGVSITEGDIDKGLDVGMGAGPGIFVGPYGALAARAQGFAKPHPVYAKDVQAAAKKLPEGEREAFIRDQVDYRDDLARRALENLPEGVSDYPAWKAAGWSRGPEGIPRKEIPDLGAKLEPLFEGSPKFSLNHPAGDLHKIYDVPPIMFDRDMKPGDASIDLKTRQIRVGGDPFNPEHVRKGTDAAMHEFQHVIQQAEGMVKGSNPMQANKRPEMAQEFFPHEGTAESHMHEPGIADLIIGGGFPISQHAVGSKAHIPSWQQKMAEQQKFAEDESKGYRRGAFSTYQRSAGETEARNVQNRRKKGFNYLSHPEDTEDITRGLQWVDTSNAPRPREEVLDRVASFYQKKHMEDLSKKLQKEMVDDGYWDKVKKHLDKKAGGGGVGNFNPERASAYGLARQGMIKSNIPGRTDKINMKVPTGSYIIPADIPSAIGEGNSEAGGNILGKMLQKGPYGMNLPRRKAGMRIGKRKASLSMSFAEGGVAEETPIVAAGGEFVVHPDAVAHLGGGDIDLGHAILDDFVKQIREKHIQTLKGLKPPKGSE